jgi:multidrug efflux pump subunit AcrB
MKKIITYFIKYPIAVNIILFTIIVMGAMGLMNMNSSYFPINESRTVRIDVVYPGASPQEIEEGVILKIEDNLRGIVGIDQYTSVSSENSASILVEILKGYDTDVLMQEIKNAVDRIPSFPIGMEPPIISKDIMTIEAFTFAVSGENIPLTTLKMIAREVETDLKSIEGISQVKISGFPDEEIEIAVNENMLRTYNLTFEDVANAVRNTNILVTGGTIKTATEDYLIRVNNRSYYGNELDHIIVKATASGSKVMLKDIAKVRDRFNENPNRSYFNGLPTVNVAVSTTSSEDLINAAHAAQTYVDDFNKKHENIQLNVTSDSSIAVVERSQLLLKNGLQGIFLVMVFMALFLRPRLAMWVAFGIPVSFLGMFIFLGSMGATINVLSLFGMIIVIGILVDDGIVISENIYKHYENGKSRFQAAIDGTMEVLPPIILAILTTVIAFSTFFFLGGIVGDSFSEIAIVVILTLAISLIEALIILPAHIAHSKALTKNQKSYWFNKRADNFINWLKEKIYGPGITFFLQNKFLGFAIPVTLLIITIGAMSGGIIRFSFFPSITSDQVNITLRMPQGTNERITDSLINHIENVAWDVNEDFTARQSDNQQVIQNIIRTIGPGTSNASLRINLLPGESRDFPSFEIADAIRNGTGPIFGIESIEYGSGNNFGGKPVSVSLSGTNIAELKGAKQMLKAELENNPLLKDVSDNDPEGIKEISIELKENAYSLGFNLNTVISQVRNGFFGYQIQRFQRGRDEIRVWVRYDEEERSSINNLDDMRIISPSGQRVPLKEIATYKIKRGEISINHLNGRREINVSADLQDPKSSAPEIMANILNEFMPIINAEYPSVTASFEGQNREADRATSSASVVLPIIFFLIFIAISFTFKSVSQPFVLLILVPFSLIGVAWGHYIHGYSVNILSFLGIIALIGIVVNDGLVLIGKFNGNLREGMKFEEALIEAGKSRFRAIFLTSVTTIAGLSPLIFERSLQAQFLIPMAISIAYGILIATVLTLIMLPLLLALSNGVKVYWTWLITGEKPTKEDVERVIKHKKNESYDTV